MLTTSEELIKSALRKAGALLSDLALGRSIQNDRFPHNKIEGPLWDKVGDVVKLCDDALASIRPADAGDGSLESIAVRAAIAGRWRHPGPPAGDMIRWLEQVLGAGNVVVEAEYDRPTIDAIIAYLKAH